MNDYEPKFKQVLLNDDGSVTITKELRDELRGCDVMPLVLLENGSTLLLGTMDDYVIAFQNAWKRRYE